MQTNVLNFTKLYPVHLRDTTEKAKGQFSFLSFDRDPYGLYDPLGRILQSLDLDGILILTDLLVTVCCLIQGSNILISNQVGSLPRRH